MNMVSFSYSNNFPLRLKSSLADISFFKILFLELKRVKGVDVTMKEVTVTIKQYISTLVTLFMQTCTCIQRSLISVLITLYMMTGIWASS